jgi:hypothetical protein
MAARARRAALMDEYTRATLPSIARRRRAQYHQAGLFALGMGLGILIVLFTNLDRAMGVRAPGDDSPHAFEQGEAFPELAPETPYTRHVARHPRRHAPRGVSARAIPTLDFSELPSAAQDTY